MRPSRPLRSLPCSSTAEKGGAVKVVVNEKDDALYMRLDKTPVVESEEIRPGVILDFDDKDQVVGLELFGVVGRIDPAELRSMHFEVA
jgi:uncharacterized protein YuzE